MIKCKHVPLKVSQGFFTITCMCGRNFVGVDKFNAEHNFFKHKKNPKAKFIVGVKNHRIVYTEKKVKK